ncbi:MAG TPA: cell division ATP-binding protein FtsE [Peptococcaceae bacterium]|nr:cell division ATP-binding protein FtsE [Peptococcaceae bacterium]
MIKLKNVSKIYPNGARALLNIDLEIDKGEFVFLVGPSGAGKSTLIKLLYREEIATRGQVIIDNINLMRLKPREVPLVRRNIGVVFQDFKLLPNKTVFENVAFAQQVLGKNKKTVKENTLRTLELVGLDRKMASFPSQLSGGEQQRVCVARALVNRPKILIADEPTGNLDMENALGIMELLDQINKMGTTVVMATHALHIVDMMKKRVVRVEAGRIVEDSKGEASTIGI